MAYDIGPKIGIDGEAEFRKAISNINTNIRTLGTEMLAVTSTYDANDKSAAALTARNEVLVKQIDAQKEKLAKLQEGLAASAEKYGQNDEKTQRWQQTVNKAAAELNQMERQLRENNDGLDSLGDSAEDAADGTEHLGSSVSAATVALGELAASGIKAALDGLKNMVSAVWGLDDATAEYREAQGKLNSAFEVAGHSSGAARQVYSDFYKILGDTDTAAEASQLLAQLAENEEDMSRWTEIAAGVAGTFGDALPINGLIEAANETAKVGQVTGALADALNWVGISEDAFNETLAACTTESERNRAIMETLSGTYADAADAFYRNNESIVQARENQALLDDTLAGLGETVSNVKTDLQAEFLPAIASAASAFSDLLNGVEGAGDALSGAIREMISTATEKLPEIVGFGSSILMSVLEGVVQNLPELVGAAAEIVSTLASGIADSLPELVPTVVDVVLQIVETLTDPANLNNLIDAALEIITALTEGLINALPTLAGRVPEIIVNIVTTLTGNLPKIVTMAGTIITTLANGLIQAIPNLVRSIPKIVTSIVSGFTSAASQFKDIGKNIVNGVWQGIQNMGSWIKQKVSGFFSGIVDGVKGVLGIHSPSKVFAGIGGYMAEGLGQGFGDEMGTVQRNIKRSMAELAGNATGAVRVETVPASGGYGGFDGGNMDLVSVLVAAIQQALAGMGIYLDGRRVGQLIATLLSNDDKAWGR